MAFSSNEYLAKEGYEFMGAAFEVYKVLGSGLSEEIYQEALELELQGRGTAFVAQEKLPVRYKGNLLRKFYFPDLVVGGAIIVELKAIQALAEEHMAQLLNYMHIAEKAVGYLVNFGAHPSLEWKRLVLRRYIPNSPD